MTPTIYYGGVSWSAIAASHDGRLVGLRFAFGKWRVESWPANDTHDRKSEGEFSQEFYQTAKGAFQALIQ